MKIQVLDIIEVDTHATLFGGIAEDGTKVTFHLKAPGAAQMARRLNSGEAVQVEVPS